MVSDRKAHYLRASKKTRIPRDHLFLDVETRSRQTAGGQEHDFRLAVSEYLRHDARRGWSTPEHRTHWNVTDLWVTVNALAKPKRRLIIWCHNLTFDLRASRALAALPAFGFDLEGISIENVQGWARFTRGDATVLMVDSVSWLPAPISKIATDLGMDQAPLPADDDPDHMWERRCIHDVAILRAAIRQVVDLLVNENLGPWRPTGSGQSHSAWRTRFLNHRPLVHDQVDALAAERAAQWTGRCEAWRWGEHTDGPYVEFDLSLAYCQIAADLELPSVLVGEVEVTSLDRALELGARGALLAEVEIETDTPVAPAAHDGHMIWPVGRFRSTLWSPELALLQNAGAQVHFHRAFYYRTAPVLRDAAQWIIDQLQTNPSNLTPVQLRLLKHWARCLVGRCALRYRDWQDIMLADDEKVTLGTWHDWDTGQITEMMQVGRRVKILAEQTEAPDSLPQIPGFIMSECRARLWRLMLTAGLDRVLYVDTDSLIVDQLGAKRLRRAIRQDLPWPLHEKGVYAEVDLAGPRMLVCDGNRRFAGVPLAATLDEHGKLVGEIFVSLREALHRNRYDLVQALKRHYSPTGTDHRRRRQPSGATVPIMLGEKRLEDRDASSVTARQWPATVADLA